MLGRELRETIEDEPDEPLNFLVLILWTAKFLQCISYYLYILLGQFSEFTGSLKICFFPTKREKNTHTT